jgi:hypothetical protein
MEGSRHGLFLGTSISFAWQKGRKSEYELEVFPHESYFLVEYKKAQNYFMKE